MCSRLVKKAIFALISIPIWVIIVLLSPFDAYAAAKSTTERFDRSRVQNGASIADKPSRTA
jgi:hypothetical protein